MNKQIVTGIIATETGCTAKQADAAWAAILGHLQLDLATGGESKVPGLGTVRVVTRAARAERKGRNPKTGEAMTIEAKPERKTVVLTPIKALKDAVNAA